MTQSVVVEHDGRFVVVNEKGPGHVVMLLPFYIAGADFLFPILMMGLALAGAYMLGRRLFGWPVGFIAALLVMSNLTVIVMWHRFYWTDAATMHLLVLAFWLMIEGNHRFNGGSLDPRSPGTASRRDRMAGAAVMALSGIAFGLSVSTRYPTGLLIVAFLAYLAAFYLSMAWPSLKGRNLRGASGSTLRFLGLVAAFALGLLLVLAPLMAYNAEYFGGPLNSGYDATTLRDFSRTGTIDVRNTTEYWTSNLGSYVSTAFSNLAKLLPMFLSRMPALLFMPVGIYCLRNRRPEQAMLLTWMAVNAFTYLSLGWVDMYARANLVPWEPRYWMPSVPAAAVLGALGIYRLAGWAARRKAARSGWPEADRRKANILACGVLAGVLVLWGAVPAVGYLSNPDLQRAPGHGGQALRVTTDLLMASPADYLGRPVLVEPGIAARLADGHMGVRSPNSTAVVPLRFAEWPAGTAPQFTVGQNISVRGEFVRDPPLPDRPSGFSIVIRYETADFARLLSPPPD
jgi:hypothetical protein